jgi:hypothetical protein
VHTNGATGQTRNGNMSNSIGDHLGANPSTQSIVGRWLGVSLLALGLALNGGRFAIGQERMFESLAHVTQFNPASLPLAGHSTPPQVTIKPSLLNEYDVHPAGYLVQIEPLKDDEGQYRLKLLVPSSIREVEITPCQSSSSSNLQTVSRSFELGSNASFHRSENGMSGVTSGRVGMEPALLENRESVQPRNEFRGGLELRSPAPRVFFKNPFFERAHPISMSSLAETIQQQCRSAPAAYLTTGYESLEHQIANCSTPWIPPQSVAAESVLEQMPIRMKFTDKGAAIDDEPLHWHDVQNFR